MSRRAGGLWEWVVVKDGVSSAEVTPRAGEVKQGDAWTGWGHVPSGRVKVSFYADGVNSPPGDCLCWNGTAYPYSGAALKEVELRRYQSTNWYFPPLRFPGQYFDAETDLHENWNRFYEPQTGRYWQQEPMMSGASGQWFEWSLPFGTRSSLGGGSFLLAKARAGRTTPSYVYAGANPISGFDPDGLWDRFFPSNGPFKNNPPAGWMGNPPPGYPGTPGGPGGPETGPGEGAGAGCEKQPEAQGDPETCEAICSGARKINLKLCERLDEGSAAKAICIGAAHAFYYSCKAACLAGP